MALVLQAAKTATQVGTSSNWSINLTTGWTNGAGGASYAPVAGDVVIVAYAIGSANSDVDVTIVTADYVELADVYSGSTTNTANLGVYRKVLTSGDLSVTLGPTTNVQWAGAAYVEVYSGADGTTPEDVTTTTANGTGTGRPNPPSITPTTSGAIVSVFGAAAAATGAAFTQSGSELSDFISANRTDTIDAMVGGGQFAWTSGAFDPVAWTGGTTGASDGWCAVCVAIRPASAPAAVPFSQGFIF